MRERDRAADLAGSWEWLEFAARLPARPVPIASGSAVLTVYSGRCIFTGLSLTNSGGSGGTALVYDGLDVSGTPAARMGIGANSTSQFAAPGQGILMEIGVTLNPATLTLQGTAYVVPLWHGPRTPPGE